MSIHLITVLCVAGVAAGCTDPGTTMASNPKAVSVHETDAAAGRTLSSFGFIGPGTPVQQAIATLGPADRDVGSGIHVYVYRLTDGSEVLIGSPGASEIWYVVHGSTDLYRRN